LKRHKEKPKVDTDVERKSDDGVWTKAKLSQIKAGEIYRHLVSPEIERRAVHDAYRRPDIGSQRGGWTTDSKA
jgi:hypothetical protein